MCECLERVTISAGNPSKLRVYTLRSPNPNSNKPCLGLDDALLIILLCTQSLA